MSTSFDRWEKDPFFSAAEEVQDSADRMETVYRTWLYSRKQEPKLWSSEELCRDLRTALGTTKWQLEEFERAVKASYVAQSRDDARERHREFITAIRDHVSRIQKSLSEFGVANGKTSPSSWARLDEGECNEFASFLTGPRIKNQDTLLNSCSNSSSDSSNSPNQARVENREKFSSHRRTASACADIGSWKIDISRSNTAMVSSDEDAPQPRRTPSMSVILGSMELVSAVKWPKTETRKWKVSDIYQQHDASPLRDSQSTQGCDDKQLNGWYGTLQRQFQRTQYQMQYNRPLQATLFLLFSLMVLVTFRTW